MSFVNLLESTSNRIIQVFSMLRRSQKEREKIDLRGRVITTMDRELSALRTGRKLSDRQGNENLSVKNLIASIEHQVMLVMVKVTYVDLHCSEILNRSLHPKNMDFKTLL